MKHHLLARSLWDFTRWLHGLRVEGARKDEVTDLWGCSEQLEAFLNGYYPVDGIDAVNFRK